MRTFLYISFLVLFAACKPVEELSGTGEPIYTIGHGAGGFDTYRNNVPPNTLEAVQNGYFTDGADGIEIDVQMTGDGVLVLYHDDFLDGNSDCKGCIGSKSSDEISACRIHSRNGELPGSYSIPQLREVFELLSNSARRPWIFLNVKPDSSCSDQTGEEYYLSFARKLDSLVSDYGWTENVFIETLDVHFLDVARVVNPAFRLIYDLDDYEAGMKVVQAKNYDGLGIVNEAITAEQVAEMQGKGRLAVVWGVRVWDGTKKAISKKPDFIMTDDIRMLRNALGK